MVIYFYIEFSSLYEYIGVVCTHGEEKQKIQAAWKELMKHFQVVFVIFTEVPPLRDGGGIQLPVDASPQNKAGLQRLQFLLCKSEDQGNKFFYFNSI